MDSELKQFLSYNLKHIAKNNKLKTPINQKSRTNFIVFNCIKVLRLNSKLKV